VKIVASMTTTICDANPVLKLDVIDMGIGMTPQQMDRLFKPFSQGDASTTRQFGGTGLGLSIARRLANLLGGNVTVASDSGKGSTFSLTLATGSLIDVPLHANPAEAISTSSDLVADDLNIALTGAVLLAEDGEANQRLIAYYLRAAGATVDIVDNGQLAVQYALAALSEDRPYDLVLMDIQMPVLDGLRATESLRGQLYSRPIVALTANAMSSDRDECLKVGCNDFLSKPIDPAKLLTSVARYLLSSQQRAQQFPLSPQAMAAA